MHVGLNLIFLVPSETGGMEVVVRELIPALVQAAPEVHFTAFINREAMEIGEGPWCELVETVTVPVRARRRVEWVRGEQQLLPGLAARAGIDVLHSLASTAPARGSFTRVVTVHDLIYQRYPRTHPGLRSLGMRVLVPLAVRRSQRVMVDSQSTRDDLVEVLHTPPAKIDVVPLGLGGARRTQPLSANATRERFGLDGRRLLLSLSARLPHKNLGALIGALSRIPAEQRPQLVLPGYATGHETQLRERTRSLGLDDWVRFPPWAEPAALEGLWELADGFVFPSLYEGFGLPVLEAMARGVPVACSDRSSLPEVARDAALLFDPGDERAIAAAIQRLLGDPAERERLRGAGFRRAAQFSWEQTAQGTLACYRRALDTDPSMGGCLGV